MRNQGNVGKRNTESLRIFVVFLLPLKVTQPLHYTLSQALLFSATKLCSNLRIGASTNNLGCKRTPTKKWRGIKSPISPKVGSSNDFRWSIDPCPTFQRSDKTPIHFRRSTQSLQFNCTASPHHFKELIDSKHSSQLTKNLHLEKVLRCDKDKGLPQKIPGSQATGENGSRFWRCQALCLSCSLAKGPDSGVVTLQNPDCWHQFSVRILQSCKVCLECTGLP